MVPGRADASCRLYCSVKYLDEQLTSKLRWQVPAYETRYLSGKESCWRMLRLSTLWSSRAISMLPFYPGEGFQNCANTLILMSVRANVAELFIMVNAALKSSPIRIFPKLLLKLNIWSLLIFSQDTSLLWNRHSEPSTLADSDDSNRTGSKN